MKRLSKPINETELQVKEVAAPSTPPSGYVYVYAKSDGKLYAKDDAGTEYDLTAAGSGAPGGSDTYVQFNDGGAFGGDANMIWNKTVNQLGIGAAPTQSSPFSAHAIQIADDTGGNSDFLMRVGGGAAPVITGAGSGGTIASPTISSLGAVSLALQGYNRATSTWQETAQILFAVDDANNGASAPTNTSMPGQIIMKTTPQGSVTPLEAVRINNKQWVGLNNSIVKSRLDIDGSIGKAISAKTASFTADDAGYMYPCDATSGAITVTLPAASSVTRRIYVFTKTDTGANTVTVNGEIMTMPRSSVAVQSNGTAWVTIYRSNGINMHVGTSAPASPSVGDLWVDTN